MVDSVSSSAVPFNDLDRATKRRAVELASKMRMNVNGSNLNNFKVETINNIPVVINGIQVPENLYTDAERRALASHQNIVSQSSTDVTNISRSDEERSQQITNPDTLVQTENPSERDITESPPTSSNSLIDLVSDDQVAPVVATFKNEDRRVRLEVPLLYLTGPAAGPNLGFGIRNDEKGVLYLNHGIIFPYTPRIELTHTANYRKQPVVHSNYAQNFYTGSEVSDITLTAKFTVQNSFEAQVLIAVQHLGRSLTKMAFGNDQNPIAGSPPPVCRLYAHGEYMLDRTPVVLTSFGMSYPDDVNYFTIEENTVYGITSVPVLTTITMTLRPVYSRNEMLNGSLTGWLTGGQRSQGYL
jgi:hypothetical protein